MEIVVNKCHGGFGLSFEAERLYAEKAGFEVHHYRQTQYKHREGSDKFERVVSDDGQGLLMHTVKSDFGNSFAEWPDDMSDYWYSGDLERDDPVLIAVVKELGEKANGHYANLQIVDVPDDVKWQIEEYDGLEWVAEAHRTW